MSKKKKEHKARNACQSDWVRGQPQYNADDELGTPMPESLVRRRSCRVCGDAVEPKSYWYCHVHNALSGLSDDNIVYTTHDTTVDSY